jgi:formylmethanofuran dehydrogenase subunit C
MTIVYHDKIEAGEVFECKDRSVIVEGHVGAGAHINIDGGGLLVNGDVADNVTIEVKGSTIQKDKTGLRADTIPGIIIEGDVGEGVTLTSDAVIAIDGTHGAGDNLTASVKDKFIAAAVGDHCRITAGGKVTITHTGKDCVVEAPQKKQPQLLSR